MKHVTIKVMLLVVAVIINGYVIYRLEVDRQTDYAYEASTKVLSGDLANGQFEALPSEASTEPTDVEPVISDALVSLIQSEPNVADLTNENKFYEEEIALALEEARQAELEKALAYDYSQPVKSASVVGDDYFSDAVFVGNSRTEGFMLYSGLKNVKSFTYIGLKVDTIQSSRVAKLNGEKVTIMEALKYNKFSKLYIMLGMNELGWAFPEKFKEEYGKVIDQIKLDHPDAIIYIQSILPVSKEKAINDPIYNNQNIDKFNVLVKELAIEKEVYYLDVASAVMDSEGFLPDGASFDGVHLKPDYCKVWLAYLKAHTVESQKIDVVAGENIAEKLKVRD
ncbi:MAG: hypothetical protein BGO41_12320 [Clostridiales bacterium 38-18]|nr:MAG: hypothetical protein BGO41_12320 [Clostridiales bacterium 38-18]